MKRKSIATKLLIVGGSVLSFVIICALAFYFYEEFTYGRIARNFPREEIETFVGKTISELDAHREQLGYRKLDNPLLGKYPFAIEAPTGAWLVMLYFDKSDEVSGYLVKYSNTNSMRFHSRIYSR